MRQGAAPGNIAAQVNLLSVGQPPVEAAPTPQGYAQQRQAMIQGQNQSHGQGMKESAVGQDGGQVPVMGSSRPRNAEIDGVAEDVQGGGAGGGMSDQKKQPLNLSQVCLLAGILIVPYAHVALLCNRKCNLNNSFHEVGSGSVSFVSHSFNRRQCFQKRTQDDFQTFCLVDCPAKTCMLLAAYHIPADPAWLQPFSRGLSQQFNSNEGQVTGTHRSGGLHEVAAAASKSSGNPPTIEEEEAAKRDRLSTL